MKGITVTLYEEIQTGVDSFGAPIYSETPVQVGNVLVAPTSTEDMINDQNLYGKMSIYQMALPKGDTHDWRNKKVEFFGQTFHTFDVPVEGIEDLIPLDWDKKVRVEKYE